MKFVIIGFDGLRPDLVGPELTPNLDRFGRQNCEFGLHHCTFPSETYVNTTSLLTGCHPESHGLVANVFNTSPQGDGDWFQGWEVAAIEALNRDGGLFLVPSAGEILGAAGLEMAVICTNTPGSARLMHHQIDGLDHLNLCPHSPSTSAPAERVAEITARLAPPAEKKIPDLDGVSYATDVFLDYLVPRGLPDLTLLWYGEPDNTFHLHGIGSPDNCRALGHTDAQLGRVLDWWTAEGRAAGVQLVIASDHGHLTIRQKVSVAGWLEEAGFRVAERLEGQAQIAMLPEISTNLWVKNGEPGLAAEVGRALMAAPWLGGLFFGPVPGGDKTLPGAFPLAAALAANPRSPHLAWTFAGDDEPNQYGWPGRCDHNIGLPLGGSMHGGLHPREMRCLLLAGGSLFKTGHRVESPSCLTDILPTILHGLGLPPAEAMTGRVLAEALAGHRGEPRVHFEELATGLGDYRQYLKRVRVEGRTYLLEGGRRE